MDEESVAGNEESMRLVTRVEEGQQDNAGVIQDITGGENENESQPLIVSIDTGTDLTERDNLRNNSFTKRVARIFGRVSTKQSNLLWHFLKTVNWLSLKRLLLP